MEQQLEEQQDDYSGSSPSYIPSPYSYNYGQTDRVELAREFDPRNTLVKTIGVLRGIVEDPVSGEEVKIKRFMNEEGISVFAAMVAAGANPINTTSNYRTDEKLIYRLLNKWIFDMVYTFLYDRKRFVIHEDKDGKKIECLIVEEANASAVINLAVGLILPSFFKALGAGDRSAITRSIQEMINRAMRDMNQDGTQVQAKRGFLSMLNPFNKR